MDHSRPASLRILSSIRHDLKAGAEQAQVEGSGRGSIIDPRFREDAWGLPNEPLLGFVEIPGGSFLMGKDEDEHAAKAPRFYMARYPVTVAQYRVFVDELDIVLGDPSLLKMADSVPVTVVAWHEALKYCDWLTERLRGWGALQDELRRVLTGTPPWRVTLPSEAEWEKAARGTRGRVHAWGNDLKVNRANYDESGVGRASVVGCFPGGRTPAGVEDLAGNVWEWTRSLWGKKGETPEFGYPYRADDGRENLAAPDTVRRVVRGGSFYNAEYYLRAAYRFRLNPDYRYFYLGFRVVVSPFSDFDL